MWILSDLPCKALMSNTIGFFDIYSLILLSYTHLLGIAGCKMSKKYIAVNKKRLYWKLAFLTFPILWILQCYFCLAILPWYSHCFQRYIMINLPEQSIYHDFVKITAWHKGSQAKHLFTFDSYDDIVFMSRVSFLVSKKWFWKTYLGLIVSWAVPFLWPRERGFKT